MFAASTCSCEAVSATLRENFVRRGRTPWIVAGALVGPGRDRDPVADGRQVADAERLVREPAGGLGAKLAELGEDDVGAAVLRGDARRRMAVRGVRFELGCAAVSPAEVLQCVQAWLLERRVDGAGARERTRAARGSGAAGGVGRRASRAAEL